MSGKHRFRVYSDNEEMRRACLSCKREKCVYDANLIRESCPTLKAIAMNEGRKEKCESSTRKRENGLKETFAS